MAGTGSGLRLVAEEPAGSGPSLGGDVVAIEQAASAHGLDAAGIRSRIASALR
jgi:hypothetical protein